MTVKSSVDMIALNIHALSTKNNFGDFRSWSIKIGIRKMSQLKSQNNTAELLRRTQLRWNVWIWDYSENDPHTCIIWTSIVANNFYSYVWKHHDSIMDHWDKVDWRNEARFILQHVDCNCRSHPLSDELLLRFMHIMYRWVVTILCLWK